MKAKNVVAEGLRAMEYQAQLSSETRGQRFTTDPAPDCCCANMHQDVLKAKGRCALCEKFQTDPVYYAKWSGQKPQIREVKREPLVFKCQYFGPVLRNEDGTIKTRKCKTCAATPNRPVHQCLNPNIGGEVTLPECYQCPYEGRWARPEGKAAPSVQKAILICNLSCGDSCVNTIALESLHKLYPGQFQTDVIGNYAKAIFANNPYATNLGHVLHKASRRYMRLKRTRPPFEVEGVKVLDFWDVKRTEATMVKSVCAYLGQHLGVPISPQIDRPQFYLTDQEREWRFMDKSYAIINAGWHSGAELKWYARWQEVINQLRLLYPKVTFVQVGTARDHHVPLDGVVNMVGKWDNPKKVREFLLVVRGASFAMGGITFLTHLCAGFLVPYLCVITGTEAISWSQYPSTGFIRYLGRHGTLPCSAGDGCGKSKWRDCVAPKGLKVPGCLDIDPEEVVEAIRAIAPEQR